VKIYLETTVPNFLFADDAPDKKRVTEVFFEWLKICPHELCVSPVVEYELDKAPEPKRSKMLRSMAMLQPTDLPITVESRRLADVYVGQGVIPRGEKSDARHVAIAVCHAVDVVVSWNLKHLVRPSRIEGINRVNRAQGYPAIRLQTPAEVMGL
jgi:hypothetical protein